MGQRCYNLKFKVGVFFVSPHYIQGTLCRETSMQMCAQEYWDRFVSNIYYFDKLPQVISYRFQGGSFLKNQWMLWEADPDRC